jgi:hypothetical protein
MGKGCSILILLLAAGLLAGAIVAAIWLAPVLCAHYHWQCPGT